MKKYILFILIPLLLFCGLPVGAVEKEEHSFQDESIYYIMIDRFNNSDFSIDFSVDVNDPNRYHGGDFQGIIDRLDYIKGMGFTTIGLSSVFDNEDNGYHGKWTKDFYQVEEHFGTLETFKKLVQRADELGLKIVIDFNVNHVGPNHSWLSEADKKEWFRQEKVNGLPTLAHENLEVKSYLLEMAKWWVEETNIDGFRLEYVEQIPVQFWLEFAQEVRKVKEDFFLLGDIQTEEPDLLERYQEVGIDGFLDYLSNSDLREGFSRPDQSLQPIVEQSQQNQDIYENPYLLTRFMDNQHVHRFTRDAVVQNEHPGPRWKMALTYLYTTPGIPFVFYGSEIALDGGEEPDNQRQMDFRTDKELVDYITSIAKIRNEHPVLTRGSMEVIFEQDGMIVFKREYEGETSVIAINNTTKSQSVTLAEELEDEKELRGLLNGDLVRSEDGQYRIILDREMAEIYVLAEKSGLNLPFIGATASVVILFIVFLILVKRKARKQ